MSGFDVTFCVVATFDIKSCGVATFDIISFFDYFKTGCSFSWSINSVKVCFLHHEIIEKCYFSKGYWSYVYERMISVKKKKTEALSHSSHVLTVTHYFTAWLIQIKLWIRSILAMLVLQLQHFSCQTYWLKPSKKTLIIAI